MSTGSGYACGITTSNKLKCWGSNGNGQLGDGILLYRPSPVLP
ncbi:MAG: RCC1 domain-containing protein [Bdellovibrionales bacterium]|nr:RCC1 domain-containing protein [Bdellovibrionales bacterium]